MPNSVNEQEHADQDQAERAGEGVARGAAGDGRAGLAGVERSDRAHYVRTSTWRFRANQSSAMMASTNGVMFR